MIPIALGGLAFIFLMFLGICFFVVWLCSLLLDWPDRHVLGWGIACIASFGSAILFGLFMSIFGTAVSVGGLA